MLINSVEHLGGYCILLCLYKVGCVGWIYGNCVIVSFLSLFGWFRVMCYLGFQLWPGFGLDVCFATCLLMLWFGC